MISKRLIVRSAALLVFGLALLAAAVPVQAQGEQYLELIRQDLKTAKVAYMTEGMELTTEQVQRVWRDLEQKFRTTDYLRMMPLHWDE